MTNKFFGRWSDYTGMVSDFTPYAWGKEESKPPEDMALECEIILAAYGGGSYNGDAFVLFERDGKLYEVNGSHCSCYGLEDQWKPEETSWAALAMRPDLLNKPDSSWYESATSELTDEARDYLKQRILQDAKVTADAKCSCGDCQRRAASRI